FRIVLVDEVIEPMHAVRGGGEAGLAERNNEGHARHQGLRELALACRGVDDARIAHPHEAPYRPRADCREGIGKIERMRTMKVSSHTPSDVARLTVGLHWKDVSVRFTRSTGMTVLGRGGARPSLTQHG